MLLEWIGFIALIFGGIIFVLAGVAFNVLSYGFSGKYVYTVWFESEEAFTTWLRHIFVTLLPHRKIFSLEASQLLTKSGFDDTMSQ